MIYKVEWLVNRKNEVQGVSSCERVEAEVNNAGNHVVYVDANSKEEAIIEARKVLNARLWRRSEARRAEVNKDFERRGKRALTSQEFIEYETKGLLPKDHEKRSDPPSRPKHVSLRDFQISAKTAKAKPQPVYKNPTNLKSELAALERCLNAARTAKSLEQFEKWLVSERDRIRNQLGLVPVKK